MISLAVSDCTDSSRDSLDVLIGFGVDGFRNPLADLVPEGDPVPLPGVSFRQGRRIRLKLGLLCGATQRSDQEVAPPEIVQLNMQGQPPIDLGAIGTDYLFSFSNGGVWSYRLDTAALAPGIWEITLLIPDGTRWVGGFEIK